MKSGFLFLLMMAFMAMDTIAQQENIEEKPTLAFGPWYIKKIASFQPAWTAVVDSSLINVYQADVDELSGTLQIIRKTNSDSLWNLFLDQYTQLGQRMKDHPEMESFVIGDEFLHRVVLQASRNRRPKISLRFIDEAKRIHPRGIYRSDLNCKH